jgi:hypothetical protein
MLLHNKDEEIEHARWSWSGSAVIMAVSTRCHGNTCSPHPKLYGLCRVYDSTTGPGPAWTCRVLFVVAPVFMEHCRSLEPADRLGLPCQILLRAGSFLRDERPRVCARRPFTQRSIFRLSEPKRAPVQESDRETQISPFPTTGPSSRTSRSPRRPSRSASTSSSRSPSGEATAGRRTTWAPRSRR